MDAQDRHVGSMRYQRDGCDFGGDRLVAPGLAQDVDTVLQVSCSGLDGLVH